VIAVVIAALLGGGCARGDIPPKAAARLENQVSWIRRAAEAGAPRVALARLDTLTATVNLLLDQGKIDHDRALDILGAAGDVRTQLALLPTGSVTGSSPTGSVTSSSPTGSFTPSPSEDAQGNHGEGNNGNGKGNGGDED
jgi:hypothetical protein